MSSQPLHQSTAFTHLANTPNHLSLGGETWSFAPMLITNLSERLKQAMAVATQKTTFAVQTKFAFRKRWQLAKSIGSETTIVFFGSEELQLAKEIQLIATSKRRSIFQSNDQTEIPPEAFTFYAEAPSRMLARYVSDQAVFILNPARPDLTQNLISCLQRDESREFALSNQWTGACDARDWFPASKLKIQLANLHKPAYLLLRTRAQIC